jgi:hypothetical protein
MAEVKLVRKTTMANSDSKVLIKIEVSAKIKIREALKKENFCKMTGISRITSKDLTKSSMEEAKERIGIQNIILIIQKVNKHLRGHTEEAKEENPPSNQTIMITSTTTMKKLLCKILVEGREKQISIMTIARRTMKLPQKIMDGVKERSTKIMTIETGKMKPLLKLLAEDNERSMKVKRNQIIATTKTSKNKHQLRGRMAEANERKLTVMLISNSNTTIKISLRPFQILRSYKVAQVHTSLARM